MHKKSSFPFLLFKKRKHCEPSRRSLHKSDTCARQIASNAIRKGNKVKMKKHNKFQVNNAPNAGSFNTVTFHYKINVRCQKLLLCRVEMLKKLKPKTITKVLLKKFSTLIPRCNSHSFFQNLKNNS